MLETAEIEIGQRVTWKGEQGHLVTSIVAERADSILQPGNFRLRVVDFYAEMKDPDAGRWIWEKDIIFPC